jgi:hypothetical protein
VWFPEDDILYSHECGNLKSYRFTHSLENECVMNMFMKLPVNVVVLSFTGLLRRNTFVQFHLSLQFTVFGFKILELVIFHFGVYCFFLCAAICTAQWGFRCQDVSVESVRCYVLQITVPSSCVLPWSCRTCS